MKKEILVVAQCPPPFHGSNVMASTMLSALDRKDYQVIFVNKSFAKSIETIGKPSLRKILRIPVLTIELLIASLFRRPVICIYFIACGKSAFLIDTFLLFFLRISRIPYILRFGGKGFYELQNEGFLWHLLVSITLSNATGGIVLGQAMKKDVNMFIPDERLVYMANAISNHFFSPPQQDNHYIQVLYLSNLIPSKGPFNVIKAANIIIKKQSNVRFIIAGADFSQDFSKQMRAYIERKSLKQFVTMPGAVYGEEKEKLFAKSDIFVFPTWYKHETFGLVNIEAMSWGLPVISSNAGAIPEIIQEGVNGFIVNPKSPEQIAERILALINNKDLRIKMGKESRRLFESKYTLEVYDQNLIRTLKFFMDKIKSD